ncbi:hypothetical protein [Chitinophaga polysaccharea]|uniref:hypothetical protein n=1 Tax=Chitinophaga polysaccharea TaxID=1293035 RepID=UPI001158D8B8|nr:hypothetical protein [Chitinophaga polysaccharea]
MINLSINIKLSIINTLTLVICTFSFLFSFGQKKEAFPEKLLQEIAKVIANPNSTGIDSVDMYTVAIILNTKGQIENVFYSDGMDEYFKGFLRHKLSSLEIGEQTLQVYWENYCKTNGIRNSTCIIQSVMVRCDETDSLKIGINELESKFLRAMTFSKDFFPFNSSLSFIWLNPKVIRWPREDIRE